MNNGCPCGVDCNTITVTKLKQETIRKGLITGDGINEEYDEFTPAIEVWGHLHDLLVEHGEG